MIPWKRPDTGIPNFLDRDLEWKKLRENRKKIYQSRVEKKGRTSKEKYEIVEEVLIQDMVSQKGLKTGISRNKQAPQVLEKNQSCT